LLGIALLQIDIEEEISEKTQQIMAAIDSCYSLSEAKKCLQANFKASEPEPRRNAKSKSKKSMKAVAAPITPEQVQNALVNLRTAE
jgi:hypothetical protein